MWVSMVSINHSLLYICFNKYWPIVSIMGRLWALWADCEHYGPIVSIIGPLWALWADCEHYGPIVSIRRQNFNYWWWGMVLSVAHCGKSMFSIKQAYCIFQNYMFEVRRQNFNYWWWGFHGPIPRCGLVGKASVAPNLVSIPNSQEIDNCLMVTKEDNSQNGSAEWRLVVDLVLLGSSIVHTTRACMYGYLTSRTCLWGRGSRKP